MEAFVCTHCKHEFRAASEDVAPEGCPECGCLEVVDAREAERAEFDAHMRGEYALDVF